VTSIAHQLGYFETIATVGIYQRLWPCIAQVTLEDVARVAARYLSPNHRTVGWFQPVAAAAPITEAA
jgi:predicted Zn-dependent peptidase